MSDTTGGSDHASKFGIDPATGQITGGRLNADVPAEEIGGATTPYEVTVTATDGDGDTTDIDVIIRVVGVNEPPKIAAGGPREMSHYESDRTPRPAQNN